MSQIVWVDGIDGDDSTGTGAYANPHKTINVACTKGMNSGGTDVPVVGGDAIHVMQGPAHSSLTGTWTFTNGSATVSVATGPATGTIAEGDYIAGYTGAVNTTGWWEVASTTGDPITSVTLRCNCSFSTTSPFASTAAKKMGVIPYATPPVAYDTEIQKVTASTTTPDSRIVISGGWDSETTQAGETWFSALNTSSRTDHYGHGIVCNGADGASFITVEDIGFVHHRRGIESSQSTGLTLNNIWCVGSQIHITQGRDIKLNTIRSDGTPSSEYSGILIDGCHLVRGYNFTTKSNGKYGVEVASYYASDDVEIDTLTSDGNASGPIGCESDVKLRNLTANAQPEIGGDNYYNQVKCHSDNQVVTGYTANVNGTYSRHGKIVSVDGASGGHTTTAGTLYWQMIPIDARAKQYCPLEMPLGPVAFNANREITATIWIYRTNTSITGQWMIKGGQLTGVGSYGTDVVDAIDGAEDTWVQYTLTATPTEAGVLTFYVQVWDTTGSGGEVYVDDLSITQAA